MRMHAHVLPLSCYRKKLQTLSQSHSGGSWPWSLILAAISLFWTRKLSLSDFDALAALAFTSAGSINRTKVAHSTLTFWPLDSGATVNDSSLIRPVYIVSLITNLWAAPRSDSWRRSLYRTPCDLVAETFSVLSSWTQTSYRRPDECPNRPWSFFQTGSLPLTATMSHVLYVVTDDTDRWNVENC